MTKTPQISALPGMTPLGVTVYGIKPMADGSFLATKNGQVIEICDTRAQADAAITFDKKEG